MLSNTGLYSLAVTVVLLCVGRAAGDVGDIDFQVMTKEKLEEYVQSMLKTISFEESNYDKLNVQIEGFKGNISNINIDPVLNTSNITGEERKLVEKLYRLNNEIDVQNTEVNNQTLILSISADSNVHDLTSANEKLEVIHSKVKNISKEECLAFKEYTEQFPNMFQETNDKTLVFNYTLNYLQIKAILVTIQFSTYTMNDLDREKVAADIEMLMINKKINITSDIEHILSDKTNLEKEIKMKEDKIVNGENPVLIHLQKTIESQKKLISNIERIYSETSEALKDCYIKPST